MKTDVIIAGAGPGGGMAACTLARSGLDVLILEKESLPRYKACGGVIPIGITRLLDWDLAPVIENQICRRKSLYNFSQPNIVTAPIILALNRDRFDAHLIERAVLLGKGAVVLRDTFPVTQVEETTRRVIVRGENEAEYSADFLIGADGALSRTAHCLGLNASHPEGVAIDAEVQVAPEVFDAQRQMATFNYFCLPHGYGWIFPKKAGLLSCGICTWRKNPHLRQALDDFLAKSFPVGSIRAIKTYGHPIPLYSGRREIATRRVCLVGDAASLVNPIMGEGIRYALQSGALAAKVVMGLLGIESDTGAERPIPHWGRADCRIYQSLIHEEIGAQLEHLRRFIQPIFIQAPEFFYRKFILGDLSYDRLAQGLAMRLSKK